MNARPPPSLSLALLLLISPVYRRASIGEQFPVISAGFLLLIRLVKNANTPAAANTHGCACMTSSVLNVVFSRCRILGITALESSAADASPGGAPIRKFRMPDGR